MPLERDANNLHKYNSRVEGLGGTIQFLTNPSVYGRVSGCRRAHSRLSANLYRLPQSLFAGLRSAAKL